MSLIKTKYTIITIIIVTPQLWHHFEVTDFKESWPSVLELWNHWLLENLLPPDQEDMLHLLFDLRSLDHFSSFLPPSVERHFPPPYSCFTSGHVWTEVNFCLPSLLDVGFSWPFRLFFRELSATSICSIIPNLNLLDQHLIFCTTLRLHKCVKAKDMVLMDGNKID